MVYVAGERIVNLKTEAQANDGRDAIAKALYGRLFGWIVRQINVMLQPDRRYVGTLIVSKNMVQYVMDTSLSNCARAILVI